MQDTINTIISRANTVGVNTIRKMQRRGCAAVATQFRLISEKNGTGKRYGATAEELTGLRANYYITETQVVNKERSHVVTVYWAEEKKPAAKRA